MKRRWMPEPALCYRRKTGEGKYGAVRGDFVGYYFSKILDISSHEAAPKLGDIAGQVRAKLKNVVDGL
jgi:hypothetical protein